MIGPGKSHSVTDVARLLATSRERVRGWIASGELAAVNIGTHSRPRYRVMPDDLDSFLLVRRTTPPEARPKKPVVRNSYSEQQRIRLAKHRRERSSNTR